MLWTDDVWLSMAKWGSHRQPQPYQHPNPVGQVLAIFSISSAFLF
jgi:hypothetical protein